MNKPEDFLRNLNCIARNTSDVTPTSEAPFGFTSRILARLREPEATSPWTRLAARAVPIGAATAALAVLLAYLAPAPVSDMETTNLADAIVWSAFAQ